MKVNIDDFKMKEGKACVLGQLPTLIESRYASKQHYHRKLEKQISKNQALPERGRIGIFNRFYYEDVLIVKVHPEILSSQRVPERIGNVNDMWQQRYQSILDSEEHLSRNGTRIVKIFLYLSQEQQRLRFLKRMPV